VKNDLPLTSVSVGEIPWKFGVALKGEIRVAAMGSSKRLLEGYR
jgi:hypothetical protein